MKICSLEQVVEVTEMKREDWPASRSGDERKGSHGAGASGKGDREALGGASGPKVRRQSSLALSPLKLLETSFQWILGGWLQTFPLQGHKESLERKRGKGYCSSWNLITI